MNSETISPATASRLNVLEPQMMELLAVARLDKDSVEFSHAEGRFHAGQELIAKLKCPAGHQLELSLRDLHEFVDNKFFNSSDVPHLCPQCAYPGISEELKQRKSTVYHRLALLKPIYLQARYVDGFDPTGKSFETYACGESFADGTQHPTFSLRFDKLVAASREGQLRHHCYVCGIKAGTTPETKNKTLEMLSGRMKLLAEMTHGRHSSPIRHSRPAAVTRVEGQSEQLSTTSTRLLFQCANADHEVAEGTADNYFKVKAGRGGFCKACLADAGARSTTELF